MNTITEDKLLQLMSGQARAAQSWMKDFHRYKDGSSVRNATLAIGKWFGMFNVLQSMLGDQDAPPAVMDVLKEFGALWNEIGSVPLRNLDLP